MNSLFNVRRTIPSAKHRRNLNTDTDGMASSATPVEYREIAERNNEGLCY